jgi:ribosomal protein L1
MASENQALPFDILLATPETLSWFRTYGRILGPKGLMPTEKKGTVVTDLSGYSKKEEKGVELKLDNEGKTSRGAMLRVVIGKVLSLHIFTNQSSDKTITTSKKTSKH